MSAPSDLSSVPPEAVAIIGMAGRFPRARNLDEFWRNLRDGVECVSFFRDEEVQWLPIEHPPEPGDPTYVKARAVMEKPDWFDAGFFGMKPREAAIMDPQHRVMLECAWEALEDAGVDPDTFPGLIGVYAGASMNTYLFTNLLTNPSLIKDHGLFASMIMNDGDFVPTRISYKLNLRGPSINVQTACSTSLVAVCLAAQSLLAGACDAALAGGVSITFPPRRGQHHLEGGILSADGHCRAFDEKASGTVLGDGAGIVVLKRLSDALADGDRIRAVILGSAMNNDGSAKIGYTAPSIDGQAECIAMAQAAAAVDPRDVAYVEAHGTGTPLGDPIEIAGLTKAFGLGAGATKSCAIGSVKSNIGHLDIAAGVAGLIKTVLALEHSQIPPSLHFTTPNPKLGLEQTPFEVNQQLRPWPRSNRRRLAGVSSFGIGGTNAHVVLAEPELAPAAGPSRWDHHLLVVSAKTAGAVAAAAANLAAHLQASDQELADIAYSLQTRRKGFAHRRAVVASTREEAVAGLLGTVPVMAADSQNGSGNAAPARRLPVTGVAGDIAPTVAFMFPGQGAQSLGMGHRLHATEPRFRATFDTCCALLRPHLGFDLKELIFAEPGAPAPAPLSGTAAEALGQTRYTQPALFVIEYALADLWMHYGVRPSAMIGHSLGEYVAACVAGVFSLEDALAIVAERARMMQEQPAGAMIAVRLTESRVASYLTPSLSLAATNARGLCVVSGPFDAITALEKTLGEGGVASRRLATSHAFHSSMMDPVCRRLADYIGRFERHEPRIPFVSNVSGTWITAAQATDPGYWASHVRQAVRFAEGIAGLVEPGAPRILLEVGPSETLAGLARQDPDALARGVTILSTLGRSKDAAFECANLLHSVGQLWAAGVAVDWRRLHDGENRRYVELPTYPFQRERHWIEPGTSFLTDVGAKREARIGHDITEAARSERGDASADERATVGSLALAATSEGGSQAAGSAPLRLRQDPDGEASATESGGSLAGVKALLGELSGMDLTTAGPEASLYQLGFDSLFQTQASLALSKRFGVEITFRQLRDQLQTLGRIAEHIDGATVPAREAGKAEAASMHGEGSGSFESLPMTAPKAHGRDARATTEQTKAHGQDARATAKQSAASTTQPLASAPDIVLPLTDAQRELWFASRMGDDVSSAYNESTSLRLEGRIDADALRRAFHHLIERHQALRTTILPSGEQQRISAAVSGELSVRDFTRMEPQARELRVREFVSGEVERPFDLTTGPLFRAHLLRVEPGCHIILLVVHHIICDGWSLGILQKDLARLYSAELLGTPRPPDPVPRFSDYVEKLSRLTGAPEATAAEEYWVGQYADGAPTLDLPADRPRPAQRTHAGAFMLRPIPADLTAALKDLAARHDCTMFALLLTAFEVLLFRLSGQDDLVVGIPAAAQVLDGADELVGHFANLLPVRNRIGAKQPFEELLRDVRRRLFDSLEHWRYPLGSLLKRLNIARDASRMPLANVVFNSTRLRGTLRFGEVQAQIEANAKRFSHFDLNFNFAVSGDALTLGAYYSSELFDEATIGRWFGHFETLLRGIVARPDALVADLPLLSEAEREQILVRWNEARLPYDRDTVISALFDAQVARTPDAVAVIAGRERIAYRQLAARVDVLARRLRDAGVGADTLVGVFLERTPSLLVTLLGILKAGGAYVPLDPNHPTERVELIISEARMPILVTEERLVAQLPAGGFDFLVVDNESASASRRGRSLTSPNTAVATSQNLAYVIFTSGSTGRPKGVAIEQRAVLAHLAWARHVYRPEELDGVLFATSVCFDVSVFEIFAPLCLGGRLIIAGNLLDVATLPAANEVTLISAVPSAMAELVRLRCVPPSVTTVALAGEPFGMPLLDALYALPHIRRVFDHYGPTETTVYSTGGLRRPGTRPSIGRPCPNERIYILDPQLRPVPVGVAGEIYIGGDKLARGYVNNPELTAERFITDPFVQSHLLGDFGRMYRTGDIARWNPDGTIELLGRADHQVKVRGFRIELGEVEAALARHPEVSECVAVARPHGSAGVRLLAFALPRAGANPSSRDLREHLRRLLPDYMLPAGIAVLERWPLSPNGKIDRKALPEPEVQGSDAGYVAPKTTTEELLAGIWRDVLGVQRVGMNDNFFELGGHSLLATQVIARVHDLLEIELSMRQFFAAPTVAGLAVAIEAALIREITTMEEGAPAARACEALARAQEQPTS